MAAEHLQQPLVVLVELLEAELRDHDHADHARAVTQRHGDQGLVDRLGAGDPERVLAVRGVADQQRLAGLGDPAGDALADLAREDVHARRRLAGREVAAEGDRNEVVPVDHEDAAVVVIDQRAQLRRDHVADLAHVVQPVQLAAQALEHLQVGDRAHVARPAAAVRAPGGLLVEEDDLVLAERLGRHHRRFGARHELAGIHRVLRALREPDRDGDAARRAEVELRQPGGQALGERGRGRLVRPAHNHAELLPAEPADHVASSHHRAHSLGKLPQDLVADAVTVDVVDALEVVDVEHQHRDGLVRPARAR